MTYAAAREFLGRSLGRATYFRTIGELLEAKRVERITDGCFRVIELSQFLMGKARAAGRKMEGVPPERHTVPPRRPAVPPERHTVPPARLTEQSSDGAEALKKLKTPKESKKPNGDSLYAWECQQLTTKKRLTLTASLGRVFGGESGEAQQLIAAYHAKRLDRGIACAPQGCDHRLIELLNHTESDAKDRIAYFRKSLLNLAEQETDAAAKAKESQLAHRPVGSNAFVGASDFLSVVGSA